MRRPTKDIRAVILDVDGTLVDSNDAHAHAWVRAFNDWGHPVTFDQVRPLIGMGGDKIIPQLTGLDPEAGDGKMIAQRRRDVFARDYLQLLTPTPGARQLVELARARGLRAVVASSAEESELEPLLTVAHVEGLVEHTVSKDEADGKSKPDSNAVQAALDYLGLPPDEVLMIGDTPYDIEAAAKTGVGTIALRCGGFSLQDLADAVAVYADPQDLVNDFDASPLGRRAAA
jgi:HAD superfamily hydrolase (TIGR01509 family)